MLLAEYMAVPKRGDPLRRRNGASKTDADASAVGAKPAPHYNMCHGRRLFKKHIWRVTTPNVYSRISIAIDTGDPSEQQTPLSVEDALADEEQSPRVAATPWQHQTEKTSAKVTLLPSFHDYTCCEKDKVSGSLDVDVLAKPRIAIIQQAMIVTPTSTLMPDH